MSSFKLFKIADLVSRLGQVAKANRFDQVSRNIHALYEGRMSQNPNGFVSSDDLKQAYSNFCGLNVESNFKNHFADVFDAPKAAAVTKDETVFGRDAFTEERGALETVAASQDEIESIKESSLARIKEVVASTVTLPEYFFVGYTKIAKMGNSGLANWKVSFPTAKGLATINIPVPVVDGFAHEPKSFFTSAGTNLPFKTASIVNFAKSYTGFERKIAAQKSGMTMLGTQSLIPTAQIQEQDGSENTNISMNFSIPINEDTESSLNNIQNKIQDAIEKARVELEERLHEADEAGVPSNSPSSVNLSLSINYSGAMAISDEEPGLESNGGAEPFPGQDDEVESGEFEYFPQDSQASGEARFDEDGNLVIVEEASPMIGPVPFQGVIAFNISKKTANGLKVATVPVEVSKDGSMKIESFYDNAGNVRVMTAQAIADFFTDTQSASTDDSEQDAFSSAFLSSDASLNELRKEMKLGIDGGNLSRANACLSVIAGRFGEDEVQQATREYFQWIDDVRNKRQTKIAWVAEDNQLSNEDIFITKS